MTCKNKTVYRQMWWAGNIAKTMTSNGKQFTVTCEMLTAVARDRWNLGAVFKFCFCFVLPYNKSLSDWSLGEQWILFSSNLNVSRDEVSGNKIHCSPRDQSLSVYCYIARLSLNKMSTVIGWFMVTCLWSNSNVSRPGYNCAVVALTPSLFAFAVWLFKGKSSYITKHLIMYGPSGN